MPRNRWLQPLHPLQHLRHPRPLPQKRLVRRRKQGYAWPCMTTATEPQTTGVPGETFLRYVLESIVEDKDALVIEGTIDDLGVLLTVQVSTRDMGKLIGKGGQTVKALRTLLRSIGGTA